MAENPSVTVAVVADIKALTTGMNEAEKIVGRTTINMGKAVDNADIGGRFNKAAQVVTRAASAMTFAVQEFTREGATAVSKMEALGQAAMMTGNKFGMVAGGAFQLGLTLNELFTGAKAEAAALAAEVAKIDASSAFKAQTRDLERQLDIVKETDPIKKRELELQREIALIRQEILKMETMGADAEARKMAAAKEKLAVAKAEKDIEKIRADMAKAAEKKPEPVAAVAPVQKQNLANLVSSITTSLGGTFNFAQNETMRSIQTYTIRQFGLQQNMLMSIKEILNQMRNGGTVIT